MELGNLCTAYRKPFQSEGIEKAAHFYIVFVVVFKDTAAGRIIKVVIFTA